MIDRIVVKDNTLIDKILKVFSLVKKDRIIKELLVEVLFDDLEEVKVVKKVDVGLGINILNEAKGIQNVIKMLIY